jgi:hypothetical protein
MLGAFWTTGTASAYPKLLDKGVSSYGSSCERLELLPLRGVLCHTKSTTGKAGSHLQRR